MAKRDRRNKSNSIDVDFSGVESRKVPSEGNHLVQIDKIEQKEGQKGDYLSILFEIIDGKSKGSKIYHNCSLAPQALFNLKALLEALGLEIPKKSFDLDLDSLVGLECIAEVSHEIYEGKKKGVITEFLEADGDPDDDEDESEIEELLEDLDEDELRELAEELGAKAKQLKKLKDEEDLIDFIIEEFDEEDIEEALEEEEDDEEDYEDMSLKELKAEAKSRGIKVKKSMDEDDIIELLEEDDEE